MKYLVRFFVITLILINSKSLFAEEKILYIDMAKLLNESNAGKSAQEYLTKSHNSSLKKFKKIEENLKKEEAELLGKKKILTKEEYKKLFDELRKKYNNYQKDRRETLEKISNQRSKARQEMLKAIEPILSNYSVENSVAIIMDKKDIILGKKDNDITLVILEKLNKSLPSLSLK